MLSAILAVAGLVSAAPAQRPAVLGRAAVKVHALAEDDVRFDLTFHAN